MKLKGYKQPDKHLYKWLDAHFAGHTFVRNIRPRNVRTSESSGLILSR